MPFSFNSKSPWAGTGPSGRPRMLAYGIEAFGAPEVIVPRVIERPRPGAGQLLVRVLAAGVGPWDAWIRAGQSSRVALHDLPVTLGSEICGVVQEVGPGVDSLSMGDEVYGTPNRAFTGGYAEYAVVQRDMVAKKPCSMTFAQAASMPVVACTAWQMLFEHACLQPGQRVLVLGGSGSVGAFAVQLAHRHGACVVATGSAGETRRLETLGADQVFDGRAPHDDLAHGRFDAVIDTVGGALQAQAMRMLVHGGVLVSAVSQPDTALARAMGVRAVFFIVSVEAACLALVASMVDAGQLMTHVGTQLPLGQARRAHEMLEGTAQRRPGKIILEPVQ